MSASGPAFAPVQGGQWLLTLIFPATLEDAVVGLLLDHPEWGSAFTLMRCEGHGHTVPLYDSDERVRGRADRLMVQIVLDAAASTLLLEQFSRRIDSPEVFYWRTPLADSGRLRDFSAARSSQHSNGDNR